MALLSTPQYFDSQCDRFRKAGWNSLQIQRRLGRKAVLPEPDAIDQADVIAVARHYVPEADTRALKRVAALALATVGFLSSIKHLRQRADFIARRRPEASRLDLLADELRAARSSGSCPRR